MLEIENEKFETETRFKDEKITDLEHQAGQLAEKLLLLKLDFRECEDRGQQKETRYKDQLREMMDELEALRRRKSELSRQNVLSARSGPSQNRVSIKVMGVELEQIQQMARKSPLCRQTCNFDSLAVSGNCSYSHVSSRRSVQSTPEEDESKEWVLLL